MGIQISGLRAYSSAIEHWFPKPKVAGLNPAGRTYSEFDIRFGGWYIGDMKQCTKCSNEASGKSGMCKPCKNEYNRAHYLANKQYYVDKATQNKIVVRNKVRQVKEETPCADCKVNYPYFVMDFDHLENKQFNVSEYASRGWATIQKEIEKCEIVCANCHRARTHARLYNSVDRVTVS